VPYADASPRQISQALLYLQEALHDHFPTLKWATWADALQQLQPDLWVEQQAVTIDEDDLTYLANRLALSSEVPALDPIIHGPRAGYLARKLVHYEDDAIYALEEIEAHPLVYGPLVYRLIVSLASGNEVADEVFGATYRGPWGRPSGPDRNIARATVSERLQALRYARGEGEFAFGNAQSVAPTGGTSPCRL
jgi:hypothetical protein